MATNPRAPINKISNPNWKKDMPAKNKIATTTAHIIAVVPRSGCDKIKKDTRPNNIKGLRKPLSVLISPILRTQYPDVYKIILNLQTSAGWMLIGPNLIHLILPFTSVPIPGINRATRSNILISMKSQSVFSNKEEGIERKTVNIKIPTPINKACLVAKWKGLPVKLSAI